MSKFNSSSFRIPFLFLCAMCFTLTSCEQGKKSKPKKVTQATIAKTPNQEQQIVDLIMNLDEVKRKRAQVEKESNGKRTLVTYVENPPNDNDPNYWVKVAEDNGDNLVAYYTFAVDDKSRTINYYDNSRDSLISLDMWRKTTPIEER
jgi:hypothetical protein